MQLENVKNTKVSGYFVSEGNGVSLTKLILLTLLRLVTTLNK